MDNIEIEELLGQRFAYKKITSDHINKSYLLIGDIGQGKRYLIQKLVSYFSNIQKCAIFNISSDGFKYDYAPFLKLISQKESTLVNNGIELIKDLSHLIPLIGETVSPIINKKALYPAEFSHTEAELLNRLRRLCFNETQVVLICNEISYWDEPSIILLMKIVMHPEILKTKICIICSDFNDTSLQTNVFSDCFKLNPLNTNKAPEIVKYLLPYSEIKDDIIQSICSSCNGNIGIMLSVLTNITNIDVSSNSLNSFHNIIISHLDNQENCMEMLDKASIIGYSSPKTLLKNYTSIGEFEFCQVLDYICGKNLLKDLNMTVDFSSETLWSIFNTYNKSNKKYHYEFAKCLKTVIPAKYDIIAKEYYMAGMKDEAVIYYILSFLHNFMSYRIKPIISNDIIDMIKSYQLLDYYNSMINLYEQYFNYEYISNDWSQKGIDSKLEFEADYFEAIYLINYKIEKNYYKRAFNKLKLWYENANFAEESPEQWIRAAFSLVGISIELHDNIPDLFFEKIENILSKYIRTDFKIAIMHYDFLAKSNCCFKVEIADKNVNNAVQFYKANLDKLPSIHKYIVALNNSLANSLILGKESNALECIRVLTGFLCDSINDLGGFTGAIINNIYIAMLLWHRDLFLEEFEQIEFVMKTLIKNHNDEISKILYKNNLAVFYCYNNEFGKAKSILFDIFSKIEDNKDIDDYYIYFIKNNFYVLNYIITGVGNADQIFSELDELTPLKYDINYFRARNKYMKEKMSCGYKISTEHKFWNNFEDKRIGEAWNLWGKWLLLSDIQFWGD